MTELTLEPVMVSERIASVDIARGFALCGVLLTNMMNYGALEPRWFCGDRRRGSTGSTWTRVAKDGRFPA
jgi:uncharacterized membrane protein YeiB